MDKSDMEMNGKLLRRKNNTDKKCLKPAVKEHIVYSTKARMESQMRR